MLLYKRENGGNEKLIGWEGGIIAKAELHGLEPAHPRSSIQNTSIPGPVLLTIFILEKLSKFSNPTKEKKKEINIKRAILGLNLQLTSVPSEFLPKKIKSLSLPSLCN